MTTNSLNPNIMVKFETYKKDIFEGLKYYKQIDTSLLLMDIAFILLEAKKDLPEDKFNELMSFANSLFEDLGEHARFYLE